MLDNEEVLRREFAEVQAEYKDDSPERFIARRRVRAIIWEKTKGRCWYCGCEMNPFVEFTVDHVIPICRGGTNDYDNLVPCCRSCNRSKGKATLERFRERMAVRQAGIPAFTDEQLEYLYSIGVNVPSVRASEFKFYFERIQKTQ